MQINKRTNLSLLLDLPRIVTIIIILIGLFSCSSQTDNTSKNQQAETVQVSNPKVDKQKPKASPEMNAEEEAAIVHSGKLTQVYIDKRNRYLKKLGKTYGILFTQLPAISDKNLLDLPKAEDLISKYGAEGVVGDEMLDFRYINNEAAKYLSENRTNFTRIIQYLVFVSHEAAAHLVRPNLKMSLASLETMTTKTAEALGRLTKVNLVLYNLKYLNTEQTKHLFQGDKLSIDLYHLAHLDADMAATMASSSMRRIDMKSGLSPDEKKIWIEACQANGWTKCFGEELVTTDKSAIVDYNFRKIKDCLENDKRRDKEDCVLFLNSCKEGYAFFKKLSSTTKYDPSDEQIRMVCENCVWQQKDNWNKRSY